MGLIKAGLGAFGGTMADQWKEFFCCDAMDKDVLVVKGEKQTSSRSSNKKGSDNVISNGSGIAVADGQCMLIVEQGKVVEVCCEPGQFTYDASSEPSLFTGDFGESLKQTFRTIGKRFTFGGDTGKDQRVYYINTKEILGNKFGTATPIMFKVIQEKIGMDLDIKVRCSGTYSYRIADPIKFYTNVCGNVAREYRREEIDEQLRAEMMDALQPAFGDLSALKLRPSDIPAHKNELKKALNDALDEEWTQRRGIRVESIAMSNLSIPPEDEAQIQRMQKAAAYSNAGMAAGMMADATATAMNAAASNANGAMNGFFGMGMAGGGMGGGMVNGLFQAAAQQQAQMPSQPAPAASWTCSCGAANTGRFCTNCGKPQPAAAAHFRCNKCGWVPEDPANPPKFCPQCGDIFDDSDKQ